MADKDKKSSPGQPVNQAINQTSQNNLKYHFAPYKGSTTFSNMKKRAEKAMTDHEFKG